MRSILLIHNPAGSMREGLVSQKTLVVKNAVAICRKNCQSVNHVTSFGEMMSLFMFFPCYHSKCELAGQLMLVAEKSVPVRSEGKYQELVQVSLDVSRKNANLYLEMTSVVPFFRACRLTDMLYSREVWTSAFCR